MAVSNALHDAIRRLARRESLPLDRAADAFRAIMQGDGTPALYRKSTRLNSSH